MSAFDNVCKTIKEWQPETLSRELQYRNSLAAFLRDRLRGSIIETEYRHNGTTVDIYVSKSGLIESTQVFVELKRNFLRKTELDRLVGQVKSIGPIKSNIIIVLCGKTNPVLVKRFMNAFRASMLLARVLERGRMAVIEKGTATHQ